MTTNHSDTDGIESIEHKGMLIYECGIPGETRKEDVFPAHPNGIPVSKNRWLLVYATRSYRGNDDDNSIIYQLRGAIDDFIEVHNERAAPFEWTKKKVFPSTLKNNITNLCN